MEERKYVDPTTGQVTLYYVPKPYMDKRGFKVIPTHILDPRPSPKKKEPKDDDVVGMYRDKPILHGKHHGPYDEQMRRIDEMLRSHKILRNVHH
jgi:hypothetical protein